MVKMGLLPEDEVRQVEVKALVDSGTDMLIISESIKRQLNLQHKADRQIRLADGRFVPCEWVGPVTIVYKNRDIDFSALVLPELDEVLLGVIPLEGLDLVIDPLTQTLEFPPDRPNVWLSRAMGAKTQ
jgi:clan AA aspartic protease